VGTAAARAEMAEAGRAASSLSAPLR